jgi:hypothetical protein
MFFRKASVSQLTSSGFGYEENKISAKDMVMLRKKGSYVLIEETAVIVPITSI